MSQTEIHTKIPYKILKTCNKMLNQKFEKYMQNTIKQKNTNMLSNRKNS